MNISMSEIAQLLPSSAEPKQMEKAEILEKTIIYIKKLQEITGKQDQGSESKIDDRQLPNQGTVIIAAFSRRKLSLFFLLSFVLIFP